MIIFAIPPSGELKLAMVVNSRPWANFFSFQSWLLLVVGGSMLEGVSLALKNENKTFLSDVSEELFFSI